MQEQIQNLQADLSQASAKAEALHADLQTAEAARQKATDELTASQNQQKYLQVGCLIQNFELQVFEAMLRAAAVACMVEHLEQRAEVLPYVQGLWLSCYNKVVDLLHSLRITAQQPF